jgi:hypothetical protein
MAEICFDFDVLIREYQGYQGLEKIITGFIGKQIF